MFFNLLCIRTTDTFTMSPVYLWVTVEAYGESCCFSIPFGQTPSAAYMSKDEASKEGEIEEPVCVVLYVEENEEENIACPSQIFTLNLLIDVVDCMESPVYSLVETVFSTKEAALEYASDHPANYENEDGNPVVYCLDVL